LLVKETAFVLFACFAAYYYLMHGETSARKTRLLFAGWVAAEAIWLALRWFALGKNAGGIRFYAAPETVLLTLLMYIGKLAFPFRLSVFPLLDAGEAALGSCALLVVLAMFYFSPLRRYKTLGFSALWFCLFLIPPSVLSPRCFYEHRVYVALFGLVPLAPAIVAFVERWPSGRNMLAAAAAAAFLIFAAVSFRYSDRFMGRMTFWRSAVKAAPDSYETNACLGAAYQDRQEYDPAEKYFRASLALDPRQWDVQAKLGVLWLGQQKYDDAMACFQKALPLCPPLHAAELYLDIGTVYDAMKDHRRAADAYRKAIAIDPKFAPPYFTLGNGYFAAGDFENAITAYREAVANAPEDIDALQDLGLAYYKAGRLREAGEQFEKVETLSPERAHLLLAYIKDCRQTTAGKRQGK